MMPPCGVCFKRCCKVRSILCRSLPTSPEGIDRLRESIIDVVITNLNMPQGTGLEVISLLRHNFPATKVVVVSAEASEYDPLETGPLLNAAEVLPKPVGVSHLLGTVNRVLGYH